MHLLAAGYFGTPLLGDTTIVRKTLSERPETQDKNEIASRRDEALRRALNTPAQPRISKPKSLRAPQSNRLKESDDRTRHEAASMVRANPRNCSSVTENPAVVSPICTATTLDVCCPGSAKYQLLTGINASSFRGIGNDAGGGAT